MDGLNRRTAPTQRQVSLGRGQRVPYPEPTSAAATAIGKANRRRDTTVELALSSALHRLGLRFRRDRLVRARGVRTHPDFVFGPVRLVVFVDGCFWHRCPDHFHMPKSNLAYWEPKLQANVDRDRRVDEALREAGWTVLRLWEHEPLDSALDKVLDELARLGHQRAIRAGEVRRSPRTPD